MRFSTSGSTCGSSLKFVRLSLSLALQLTASIASTSKRFMNLTLLNCNLQSVDAGHMPVQVQPISVIDRRLCFEH